MQKVQSNFVKPAGLAVLGVCALLSAYLGINVLFAVLAGVFLVCLIAWLWTRFSLDKVEISTAESELRGFPGSELSASINVFNNKLLPVVWMEVALKLPEESCVSSAESRAAMFSWVMPRQKISWHESFKAERRGICTVEIAEAASGDGFGLSEIAKSTALPHKLMMIVYPSLLDISVSMLMHRMSELEPSKKGFYTDPTLLMSVRNYSPGDSARDISWRLLARQGKVYVNVREKMDLMRMCLAVDLESCEGEQQIEHMLSVAASAAAALGDRGVFCTLVLPSYQVPSDKGPVTRPARLVIPQERETQTEEILAALAGVEYKGGKTGFPLETMSREIHSLGQVFCFTRSYDRLSVELEPVIDCNVWHVIAEGPERERTITETELLR